MTPSLESVVAQIEQALEAGPASVFYIDQRLATACNPHNIRILLDALGRYEKAIVWALGAGEDFPVRREGQGAYWWRMELAERAGLLWDGEMFVSKEQPK